MRRIIPSIRRYWWALSVAGILLVACALRVVMLVRANWMMDGDEATMALVGRHIQREHERPIFFPGQAYMGAWQAYLCAVAFHLFGMSRPVAKLVPLLSSLVFVATTMLLARRVYGRHAALVAGVFAALPSVYLLSATLRLSYPLIDVMAIGNIILLVAVDTVWRDDLERRCFVVRALFLGLLVGFGFWLHAAVAVFAVPAGLAMLLRWPRRALFPGVPLALTGFVIGSWPVFQFARSHQYTTFHYLLGRGSDTAQRDYPAIARHLVRTILPRILGVSNSWEPTPVVLQLAIGLPATAAVVYLGWRLRRAPLAWLRARPQDSHPEALVALLGVTIVATYMLSRFSVYAIRFAPLDATGRYLAPLGAFLPLAYAGAVRAAWGRSPRFRAIAVGGAALLVAATTAAWAISSPRAVFQSPYYRELPAENDNLIHALDAMGVDAVWMNHWAGKPLMFDSDERIAAADWVDLRVCNGIDRLGVLSNRVFADESPAFVVVSTEPETALERTLSARGIRYDVVRVDGYVVIHPLGGPVDPASVAEDLWRHC